MGDSEKHVFNSEGLDIWQYLQILRRDSLLCDTELHVDSGDGQRKIVRVHSVVLLYYSRYFQKLYGNGQNNSPRTFFVNYIQHEPLQRLLQLLYKEINYEEALVDQEEVLRAACLLQIDLHDAEINDILTCSRVGLDPLDLVSEKSTAQSTYKTQDGRTAVKAPSLLSDIDKKRTEGSDEHCLHAEIDTKQVTAHRLEKLGICHVTARPPQTPHESFGTKTEAKTRNLFKREGDKEERFGSCRVSSENDQIVSSPKKPVTNINYAKSRISIEKDLSHNLRKCAQKKRSLENSARTYSRLPKEEGRITAAGEVLDEYCVKEKRCKTLESTSHLDTLGACANLEQLYQPSVGLTFDLKEEDDEISKAKSLQEQSFCSDPGAGFENEHVTTKGSTAKHSNKQNGKWRVDTEYKGPRDCEFCQRSLPSKAAYERHRLVHTGERPWVCQICGKTFNAKINLKLHEKTHMKRQKEFECSSCSAKFYTAHSLQHHMRYVHMVNNIGFVNCELCGKSLKSKYTLKKHKEIAHSDEIYNCVKCDRNFKSAAYLAKHMLVHTKEKPYACPFCNEHFRSQSARETHVNTQHTKRTFVCEVCGKTYFTKPVLLAHVTRAHGKQQPKECKLCNKKVSNYYNHMRMHRSYDRGEVHSCSICGKSFPLKIYLHQHMRVHTESKYKCQKCPKVFNFKSGLKSHEAQGICNQTGMSLQRFTKRYNKQVSDTNAHASKQDDVKLKTEDNIVSPADANEDKSKNTAVEETKMTAAAFVVSKDGLLQLSSKPIQLQLPSKPTQLFSGGRAKQTVVIGKLSSIHAAGSSSGLKIGSCPTINLSASTRDKMLVAEGIVTNKNLNTHRQVLIQHGQVQISNSKTPTSTQNNLNKSQITEMGEKETEMNLKLASKSKGPVLNQLHVSSGALFSVNQTPQSLVDGSGEHCKFTQVENEGGVNLQSSLDESVMYKCDQDSNIYLVAEPAERNPDTSLQVDFNTRPDHLDDISEYVTTQALVSDDAQAVQRGCHSNATLIIDSIGEGESTIAGFVMDAGQLSNTLALPQEQDGVQYVVFHETQK